MMHYATAFSTMNDELQVVSSLRGVTVSHPKDVFVITAYRQWTSPCQWYFFYFRDVDDSEPSTSLRSTVQPEDLRSRICCFQWNSVANAPDIWRRVGQVRGFN